MKTYEQYQATKASMRNDLLRRWGEKLPARLKSALIESGFDTVEDVIAAFKDNYQATAEQFLRSPGCGRQTVDQILSLLDIEPPQVQEPMLTGRRLAPISTDGVELTKRERFLIRKLIAGFKAVYDDDYESPLLDELIALRDKL